MIVAELIALLQQQNPDAEVYVCGEEADAVLEMRRITAVEPIDSSFFGTAILIEIED